MIASPPRPRRLSFVDAHKQAVLELLPSTPGYALCERLTWEVDTIVLGALGEALLETAFDAPSLERAPSQPPSLPPRWALMALGGYGRGQMCLRSDIDLQLVLPDGAPDPQPLMEAFLDRLTRRGLKLGHGVRTVTESLMLARDEPTFATAALTARHLAGDPTTTESVRAPVYQHLSGPGLATLLDFVSAERMKRSERLGDTVFVLEPDLKHGIGGLRDAQLVGWLSLITGRPLDRKVAFAEDLLLRVRLALHALVTFKCDRLALDYQLQVARALGYDGDDDLSAVQLMRDVHLALRALSSRARRHLETASHRLSTPQRLPIAGHPGWVRVHGALKDDRLARADGAYPRSIAEAAQALRVAARTGLPLEADIENGFEDLADQLRQSQLDLARLPLPPLPREPGPEPWTTRQLRPTAPTPGDPELAALLLELFLDPGVGASLALHALHRSGLLISLVPEFGPILGRVQRDLYHVYTVDEHTLRALDKLKSLTRGEHPDLELASQRIATLDASTRKSLFVATFLHDLGKGYGPGHHERGAELAAVIGPRLGLSPVEVELVQLLVRHQADMPMIGLRRDLADPRPVRGLARLVGDVARLDALYLLSIADWSSVGPLAFSAWQRALLDALYMRTRDHLLDPGLYADPRGLADDKRSALALAELGQVPQAPSAELDPIDDFCAALPTRYFQLVDATTMRAHYHLWRRHRADGTPHVDIAHDPAMGQSIVTIVCHDSPGVLAQLTGALSEAGADVISAEITSLADQGSNNDERATGSVLDVFRILDPHGRFSAARGKASLEDATRRALAGHAPRPRAADSAYGALSPASALPPVRPQVLVDNDAATSHSIVDVVAADRHGLLHDLARFFHDADVSVDLAFVTTEGRVAHDSFYVATRQGERLDAERLGELGQALGEYLGAH